MAAVSRVCGATGFMMWCQAVCGLYLQQSGNPALMGETLLRHAAGTGMGGTALSNPMKSYAQIESLLLKATKVEGGYLINGTLPWVSNLQPDHYCGAIAAVMDGAELCLRATQSALMHQGARGYLMSSAIQRRVREAHFVAIVTPAIKHLRKEIARLSAEEMPA